MSKEKEKIIQRWKEAIDAIGSDVTSKYKQHVADLGLRVDKDGNFRGYGDYMHSKVTKLNHQVHSKVQKKSDIFKGISFYIDGFTHPPANVIRVLVTENGGEYHHYYGHGKTTYVVAECLANTKKERLRKNEKVIKPSFITDCIQASQLLDVNGYLFAECRRERAIEKGQGRLWDFMKTKNGTKENGGTAKETSDGTTMERNVAQFEWVSRTKITSSKKPKIKQPFFPSTNDGWSSSQEQNEMRMKISDVCKVEKYRPIPARPLGVLPNPPQRPEITFNSAHQVIANKEKVSIAEFQIQYGRKPQLKDYRRLLLHFTQYVLAFQIGRLKKAFQRWERFGSNDRLQDGWKSLTDAVKRYLNWYSFNHHQQKIYMLEEGTNDEEEFAAFLEDVLKEFCAGNERSCDIPDVNEEDIFLPHPEECEKEPETTNDKFIDLLSSESEKESQYCVVITQKPCEIIPAASSTTRHKATVSSINPNPWKRSDPSRVQSTAKKNVRQAFKPPAVLSNVSNSRNINALSRVQSTTTKENDRRQIFKAPTRSMNSNPWNGIFPFSNQSAMAKANGRRQTFKPPVVVSSNNLNLMKNNLPSSSIKSTTAAKENGRPSNLLPAVSSKNSKPMKKNDPSPIQSRTTKGNDRQHNNPNSNKRKQQVLEEVWSNNLFAKRQKRLSNNKLPTADDERSSLDSHNASVICIDYFVKPNK